jgi:hypothetical protein
MTQEPAKILPELTVFGIDLGNGKDASAEVEYRLLPDGTREIAAMRTWRHEIELAAEESSDPGQ